MHCHKPCVPGAPVQDAGNAPARGAPSNAIFRSRDVIIRALVSYRNHPLKSRFSQTAPAFLSFKPFVFWPVRPTSDRLDRRTSERRSCGKRAQPAHVGFLQTRRTVRVTRQTERFAYPCGRVRSVVRLATVTSSVFIVLSKITASVIRDGSPSRSAPIFHTRSRSSRLVFNFSRHYSRV